MPHCPARPCPIARAVALAVFVVTFVAGTSARAQARFDETAEVVVVEVPVQVIRDGRPVGGLTADDFIVYDRRRKQELVGFDVVDLRSSEADGEGQPVSAPMAARRHFLLLFDLSFSQPAKVLLARRAAYEVVSRALHPSDLVAVASYSESRGASLVLGFTSDRVQVQAAIETLGVADPMHTVTDPFGLVVTVLEPAPGYSGGFRSGSDQLLLDQLQDLSGLGRRAAHDQKVAQLQALSGSLAQIAGLMKSVQGRKHVVYFSEGFDSSVALGIAGTTEQQRARIEEINQAVAFGEFWNVSSEERFGDTAALDVFRQMLDDFRRADCIIQAVDIGGLRGGGAVQGGSADSGTGAPGQDGLFMMAEETGGELYRNFNDLSVAMRQMLERTSLTYVLAFNPKDLKLDGEYHNLRVELRDRARGTRLVYRPGYYAPRPYSQLSQIERRLIAAEAIVGGKEGGRLSTSVLAAPVRVAQQQAYVPVLVEIDGSDLLAGHEGDVIPTEIYGYALSPQGGVADFFAQAIGLDAAQAAAALEQSGFKYWGHFDLDPGEYTVRVMVRNGETGASGLASVPLRVPVFEQAETALLPPLFLEPSNKWLIGREQQDQQRDVPYPFMLKGQAFIPAARPAVRRGGEAQLCLMGYNLADGVTVKGQLFDRDESPADGWELAIGERTAVGGVDLLLATFRPGHAPAGEYTLVVTVADAAGGAARNSSIPVLVED